MVELIDYHRRFYFVFLSVFPKLSICNAVFIASGMYLLFFFNITVTHNRNHYVDRMLHNVVYFIVYKMQEVLI